MIEILAVFAIIGVLAAVAVPSMLVFVERGNQMNRTNIARTVYLAAQNQLTEQRITKNLKAGQLASDYYTYDLVKDSYIEKNETYLMNTKNVFTSLGDYLPPDEIGQNEKYVHYISKAKGVTAASDPVIELLDPVILDKSILNSAILIEYNIKTGVVLSVFYSDAIPDGDTLGYTGTGDDSVAGTRGMGTDGYAYADARKQGYYGVESTGELDEPMPTLINVYDSYSHPDDIGSANVLYARILIPVQQLKDGTANRTFDLLINGEAVETDVSFDSLPSGLSGALGGYAFDSNSALLYRNDDGVEEGYARVFWILDYVGGDMSGGTGSNAVHSIYTKYAAAFPDAEITPTQNLRVGIEGSVSATSFTEAHPYFLTEHQGLYKNSRYTVMSARHLYNVRYAASANFMQRAHIDLAPVTKFAPILNHLKRDESDPKDRSFTGTYTAAYLAPPTQAPAGYAIQNLRIDMPEKNNVGLFESIGGVVAGLTLENPSISGNDNVGSVCGSLYKSISGIYVKYSDGADEQISGTGFVGGIVGENRGTITDVTFISPTTATHIVGTNADAAGGLVGNNATGGTLKRALFLALAPENESEEKISPIVSIGSDTVPAITNQLYYLSGAAIRPTPEALDSAGYNTKALNFPNSASGLGTWALYDTHGKLFSDNWLTKLKDGPKLTYEQATDDVDNNIYPYPYSAFSEEQTATGKAWPIADDSGEIKSTGIAYYEKYADDDTYGLWFLADGHQNDGSLNSGKTIAEAGYAIVLEEELLAHSFFAGTSGDSVELIAEMEFTKDNAAFTAAAKKHAEWQDKDEIWSFLLPLDKLSRLASTSKPLSIICATNSTGAPPMEAGLQPLFAKGVYDSTNPTEFFIRTPWQMQNINKLTGTANDTDGKTFTQERELDYTHTGVGVNVSAVPTTVSTTLTRPAINGEFHGTYQGKGQQIRAIRNVEMKADTGNAALFEINKGTIKYIALTDSEIISHNASAAGIAVTNDNSGRIENCKVTRSTPSASMTISGNMEMSGIALTNTGTITGASVENTTITSHNSAVAGIAGTNSGSITNTSVKDSSVTSQNTTAAGITGTNSGTISGGGIAGTTVTGPGAVGGIAVENFGTISGISVTAASAITSSNNSVGGVAKENNGKISNATVQDSTVTTPSNSAAGIAAYNYEAGSVENSTVTNVTVSGLTTSGGVARENRGSISKTNVRGSRITSLEDSAGGIAGYNAVYGIAAGKIEDCTAANITVSGSKMVGGAAGDNQLGTASSGETTPVATIRRTTVDTAVIRGDNSSSSDPLGIGGIAGSNAGIVEDCTVIKAELSNGLNNIGGIAGNNTGSVLKSGVEYSTVAGNNSSVGGVVGNNSGIVEDVFFLSTTSPTLSPPHSGRAVSNSGGGIAGINRGDVTRALYLAPAPQLVSTPDAGSNPVVTIYPIVRDSGTNEQYAGKECFYLSGYRYSLNEGRNWFPTESELESDDESAHEYYRYNRFAPKGGGIGLVTSFIAKDWLSFVYNTSFDEWLQPGKGYPYPIIRNGMTVPTNWPVTDKPIRDDQLDREDWAETLPTSNRAQNLNFINGDFDAPLMNPNNPDETRDSTNGNYWNPVALYPAGPLVESNDNISSTPSGNNTFWRYFHQTWVQGWNTRPVVTTDKPIDKVNSIEFQRPNADANNGRVRTNYNGGMDGVYAELNAEVQGTLYQIAPTVPGTELYYSFYHARRTHNSTSGYQRMNFYLSDMVDKAGVWDYKNGTSPTIIRPCITPRDNAAGTKKTRESVVYGATQNNDAENVTVGRVDFYNPKTKAIQNAFLVDVWVCTDGNSTPNAGNGYGITFWSTSSLSVQTSGTNSRIPTNGITQDEYKSGAWSWLTSARNNVIGYWDVKQFNNGRYSEWKQYYGLYTIPEGQISTEFAFESASIRNPMQGNYLDGITFQSPGFLSIDKYVRYNRTDVKFVNPGDPLTVDLAVKNWGEVPVNNIVIKDRISPFDAYIDYVGEVTMNGASIDSRYITAPRASNNYTLTIELPDDVVLKTNEELMISFKINVKEYVRPEVPTLLYYFRNQATVSYYDTAYRGYTPANAFPSPKANASGPGPVQVFIDPIKLTKTVTPQQDGPFDVTLTVENARDGEPMVTTGLISDAIPAGFVISDYGTLPAGSVTDDGTRIAINGADLSADTLVLEYRYTLEYAGDGYGVSYTSASIDSADYKYLYEDENNIKLSVKLVFPQPVVGITVQTKDTSHVISADNKTYVLDILGNSLSNKLADDNYDVSPVVVLLEDKNGTEAKPNPNGDYQINHADYTATLVKSTNQLQFTPTKAGVYDLYYQINLTATKSGGTPESFDLSSKVEKVTVTVIDADTLVYYEEYGNGTYGLYAAAPALDTLDPAQDIIESGYGVLSVSPDKMAQLDGGATTDAHVNCADAYLYKLDTDTVENADLLAVRFGDCDDAASMAELGKIHPNFAKAVYPAAETSANTFAIRTPQQMHNISQLTGNDSDNATKDITFIQEHDLDFKDFVGAVATAGTTAALENSVVTGVFEGTFTVATSGTTQGAPEPEYTISNVTIDSVENDIGLFSQNSGTITGITLRPTTSIKGEDNVGGIVGHNLPDGTIKDCIVEGEAGEFEIEYIGMHIEGNYNVGGIAGLNDGEILDCTVRNTTQTIKGYDYVGGIAGLNGVSGTISAAKVFKVTLKAVGDNVDAFAGNGNSGVVDCDMPEVHIETIEVEDTDTSEAAADDAYTSNDPEASEESEPSSESESGSEPPDAKEPDEPEGVPEPEESDEPEETGESEADSESPDMKEPEEPEGMQGADEPDESEASEEFAEAEETGETEHSNESGGAEAAEADAHLFGGGYSPQ